MQEVFFTGAMGRLEGRFHKSSNPRAPLVLVLHPSPLQGGSMKNKVTYTIAQSFIDMGFSVLRFNFRGVGNSKGTMDGSGVGELADAIIALDWLQNLDNEATSCWIAGFSFGSYIAAQILMRRPEIKGFIFVSPPVETYNFDIVNPCPSVGLMIQGTKDALISESSVAMQFEKIQSTSIWPVEYATIENADHLYSGHLEALHDTITAYVPNLIDAQMQAPKQDLILEDFDEDDDDDE